MGFQLIENIFTNILKYKQNDFTLIFVDQAQKDKTLQKTSEKIIKLQ